MAKGIIISGGNGGDNSDDCTVTADKVVAGEKYIGKDTDDDVGVGILPDRPSQTDGISMGYNTNTAKVYMRIPTGAYRKIAGPGYPEIMLPVNTVDSVIGLTVEKLLAGQVAGGLTGTATNDANAEAKYIYKDKTAYVKGKQLTGSMTVSSVVSFSVAAYSTSQVLCTWKNPANGPYGGVIIRYKTGSYPKSVTDGTQGYKGTGTNSAVNGTSTQIIGGLSAGTTYYFRIWMYCDTSEGTLYSGYKETTVKTTNSGRKVFTTSETFTVPANVRSISIHCTGGGGSGGWGNSSSAAGSGGGGAGGRTNYLNGISVAPGQVFSIVVGAGSSNWGSDGGASSAISNNVTVVTAAGGVSGGKGNGGKGGSGGGAGAYNSYSDAGGAGGSNGNNGAAARRPNNQGWGEIGSQPGGAGQGSTTREFGTGTLYSGGGGGAVGASDGSGGIGGDGGGGAGSNTRQGNGVSGTNGSGGGGGGCNYKSLGGPGNGGSGNVIIKW